MQAKGAKKAANKAPAIIKENEREEEEQQEEI